MVRLFVLSICLIGLIMGLLEADHLYNIGSGGTAEQLVAALLEGATWIIATLTLGTWLVVELALIRAWFRDRSMAGRSGPASN